MEEIYNFINIYIEYQIYLWKVKVRGKYWILVETRKRIYSNGEYTPTVYIFLLVSRPVRVEFFIFIKNLQVWNVNMIYLP